MAATLTSFLEHAGPGRRWMARPCCTLAFRARVCSAYLLPSGRGENWGGTGGGGGAMSATLVNSIPLPARRSQTPERAGQRIERAYAIAAERDPRKSPRPFQFQRETPSSRASANLPQPRKAKPKPKPEERNRERGPLRTGWPGQRPLWHVHLGRRPRADSDSRAATATSAAGLPITCDIVRRKVSDNWLKYEVDPAFRRPPRVHRFRHQSFRAAHQRSRRPVERYSLARPVGGARAAAHRYVRTATFRLLGQ